MYEHIARALRQKFIGVTLNQDFSVDLDRMAGTIKRENPACVFIAYPNNPSGNCFAEDSIDAIINAADGLVIIDEAYHAFCGKSYLSRIAEFENVVVMRTLSKIGLAGLRLGFLMGNPHWMGEFEKIRLPYNINCLTQASVVFVLKNYSMLEEQAQTICNQRSRLYNALHNMPGIDAFPSQANFILFRSPPGTAEDIHQALIDEKVLIKIMQKPGETMKPNLLLDCLRVTVGSPEQNNVFIQAMRKTLG